MREEPDPHVLELFLRGDRGAFEDLFRRYERDVYAWSLKIVRDPSAAEDVVIEAFWRAHRGRARFDASRSFGAWMRRIATNSARDLLRRRARWNGSGELADSEMPVPVDDRGAARTVALALQRLSPKLRVVATLALVEEEPYAEIADALDVPLGTVKSRVSRAMRALRRELARLGVDHG